MVRARRSVQSTVTRRTGVWLVEALACNVILYALPAVRPVMVVLRVVPPAINATFFPFGIVPLSANWLVPPAGFRPAPVGTSAVQPVIGVLSLIYPGAVVKVFASKLGLVIVWP